MPTRVQSRPTENLSRTKSERYHDYDPATANKNIQHKEALRLALGSILTPKRPYTPSSRSSSGTASPAPFSFSPPASSPLPPPPPQSTPVPHGYDVNRSQDSHSHPRHAYPHPHLHHQHSHTPSRLGLSDGQDYLTSQPQSSPPSQPQSQPQSTPGSPHMSPLAWDAFSNAASRHQSPTEESLPALPAGAMHMMQHETSSEDKSGAPAIHAPAPLPVPSVVVHHTHASPQVGDTDAVSGSGTPKAKFFETLQSKSAWEALIHGSFS